MGTKGGAIKVHSAKRVAFELRWGETLISELQGVPGKFVFGGMSSMVPSYISEDSDDIVGEDGDVEVTGPAADDVIVGRQEKMKIEKRSFYVTRQGVERYGATQ